MCVRIQDISDTVCVGSPSLSLEIRSTGSGGGRRIICVLQATGGDFGTEGPKTRRKSSTIRLTRHIIGASEHCNSITSTSASSTSSSLSSPSINFMSNSMSLARHALALKSTSATLQVYSTAPITQHLCSPQVKRHCSSRVNTCGPQVYQHRNRVNSTATRKSTAATIKATALQQSSQSTLQSTSSGHLRHPASALESSLHHSLSGRRSP